MPASLDLFLLPSLDGYRLGDRNVKGFDDPVSEAPEIRLQIARWADLRGVASDVQEKLLRSQFAAESDTVAQEAAEALAAEMEADFAAVEAAFTANLSAELRDLVRDPARHRELSGRSYPLTISETATLTGATQRQLRYWVDLGLLPETRVANERVFYAAAAGRAMRLAKETSQVKAVLAQIARVDGSADAVLGLIGSVLVSTVAPRLGTMDRAAVMEAAQTLLRLDHDHVLAASSARDPEASRTGEPVAA